MRKNIFYLLLLTLLTIAACQEKTDVKADKEAIKATNQKILNAIENNNIEILTDAWIHEPFIVHAGKETGTEKTIRGWDSLSIYFQNKYKRGSERS